MTADGTRNTGRDRHPSVAVVIPVRNNRDGVRRCIRALRAAAYAGPVAVTVVDNGSVDGSGEVADSMGARVVHVPDGGAAAARNAGAAASEGEVLAFVDADQRVAADWLARGVETLLAHPLSVVGASQLPPEEPTWVQATYDGLRSRPAGVESVEWLAAGGLLVRRDTFERVGGFDVTLETCEDVDFCRRVRALDGVVLNDGRLRVVHDGDPPTLAALFRGELWRGKDNLRFAMAHRPSLRELPSVLMPVMNLVALGGILAGAVAWPRGGAWLVAGGMAVLAGTATLRAVVMARRLRGRGAVAAGAILPVAATYEMARALAIVFGASHQTRRR